MSARRPRCLVQVRRPCRHGPRLDRHALQRVVDAACAADGLDGCVLNLLLVDAAGSAALHRRHFGLGGATDVMTFPDGSHDPASGRRLLGDVAVCVDVAVRVAGGDARAARAELVLYALHGLLHLLGHDDRTPADRAAMWAVQRDLLARVGLDPGDGD